MKSFTKTEIVFIVTALENCAKDMLAEVDGLRAEGLNAWAAATKTRADDYNSIASRLKEAVLSQNKRIEIRY